MILDEDEEKIIALGKEPQIPQAVRAFSPRLV
jgi:hypothetical protein